MTTETQNTTEQKTSAQEPNLTIQDLAGIKTVIDIAAQRGAFKAAEMTAVGTIYNKLSLFLDAVTPKETETSSEKESAQNG